MTTEFVDFMDKIGIPMGLLIGIGWFLAARVWPFTTGQVWPAMSARWAQETGMIQAIRDAVIEQKSIMAQIGAALEQNNVVANARLGDVDKRLGVIEQKIGMLVEANVKVVEKE